MIRSLLVSAVLIASPVLADFPEDSPDDALRLIKADIQAGRLDRAESARLDRLAFAPGDADVLNLLGYANRKWLRHDKARRYYTQALAIEPAHLGALEYMGELELETGQPDAARALLERLAAACPAGCEELDDLREAFAAQGIAPRPHQ